MPLVRAGGVTLHYDPPEAGRYSAKILVLPGLFQSLACWRGLTAMLAHRGWEVYLLPRTGTAKDDPSAFNDNGWQHALDGACEAASKLDQHVIVLGADVGAALTCSMLAHVRPMAMALFAPSVPGLLPERFERTLGGLARRRFRSATTPVEAPPALARQSTKAADVAAEPRRLFEDLRDGVAFTIPDEHPPSIVFAPGLDPLVETDHALEFAATPYAKASAMRLNGRWWPVVQGHNVADEVHRFLILTLSDRVVDFPDEILES
jgi:hypothetical protein